jgi:hypothetical protein
MDSYVREGCSFGLEPEVPWGAQDGVRHGAQALERPLEEITHFVKRNLETRLVQTIGEENEVDTVVCSAPAIFGHVEAWDRTRVISWMHSQFFIRERED